MTRTLTASATALVLALSLVACGSTDSDPTSATDVDTSAASTELADADVEFAQGMIAHHEQAIEMAEFALDPAAGASAAVVDLAKRISDAQDGEIELMTSWLTAAGESITMDMSDGHDMSAMPGMMSAEDMDALATMSGTEFDRMWLEMMIAHHEGAITQADDVLATGSNPDVRALAEQIITTQQGEIDEMRALLAG